MLCRCSGINLSLNAVVHWASPGCRRILNVGQSTCSTCAPTRSWMKALICSSARDLDCLFCSACQRVGLPGVERSSFCKGPSLRPRQTKIRWFSYRESYISGKAWTSMTYWTFVMAIFQSRTHRGASRNMSRDNKPRRPGRESPTTQRRPWCNACRSQETEIRAGSRFEFANSFHQVQESSCRPTSKPPFSGFCNEPHARIRAAEVAGLVSWAGCLPARLASGAQQAIQCLVDWSLLLSCCGRLMMCCARRELTRGANPDDGFEGQNLQSPVLCPVAHAAPPSPKCG